MAVLTQARELVEVIAAHLKTWDSSPAHVELAIFETDDAQRIASEIDAFCQRELGSGVAHGLFYQTSIGSVSGVELVDTRRVVVKVHQPERTLSWLSEVARVQRHLASLGLYATELLAGPSSLGRGHATVERFADGGTVDDAHRPEIRRALAQALYEIVAACRPLVSGSQFERPLLFSAPEARLWPVPHSKLFDFEATSAGAEWIDAIAIAARSEMKSEGELVIGHGDWRAEHVRFVGTRPVVAFDWDSLCLQHEPALLGQTAHAFCADWTREAFACAPTLEEARQFVADYETARGAAFGDEERRQCGAAFAYACAYTARCSQALGADERAVPGTFMHLVAEVGLRLLAL